MKLSLAPLAIVSLASFGCASIPAPKAQPNGEPLSVREKTQTYTYQTQEKIGEVQHRTSNGQNLGTSAVYANRTHVGSYTVWSGFQGDAPVSDDDFYRIAKDKKAAEEIKDSRESGVLMNRIGLGILAGGLISVAGGFALRSDNPDNKIPSYLAYGGMLLVPVGGILAYMGVGKASNPHPLEQERAESAANAYNAGLGSVSTTRTTSAKLDK
jgi:hypothetical protein